MGWLLDVSPFLFHTYLDLQTFMFSSFFDPILKLPRLDIPVSQIGYSNFSNLAKFGRQHMPPCLLVKLVC
jgi:hypothetical protein